MSLRPNGREFSCCDNLVYSRPNRLDGRSTTKHLPDFVKIDAVVVSRVQVLGAPMLESSIGDSHAAIRYVSHQRREFILLEVRLLLEFPSDGVNQAICRVVSIDDVGNCCFLDQIPLHCWLLVVLQSCTACLFMCDHTKQVERICNYEIDVVHECFPWWFCFGCKVFTRHLTNLSKRSFPNLVGDNIRILSRR
jgi:hypothetical protein